MLATSSMREDHTQPLMLDDGRVVVHDTASRLVRVQGVENGVLGRRSPVTPVERRLSCAVGGP